MSNVYQCDLETGEPIFLPELQSTIDKSPFEHVVEFSDCFNNNGIIMGSNYEGRVVEICSEDEFIVFE